jgi:hypothetical protein
MKPVNKFRSHCLMMASIGAIAAHCGHVWLREKDPVHELVFCGMAAGYLWDCVKVLRDAD